MGAGRKPAVYVTVGEMTYAPGEEIPADVVKLIDNPKVWGESPKGDDSGAGEGSDGPFDPSENGVDEVNNHLADSEPDEVQRVLAAEAAGKNRKGIVEGAYAEVG